VDVANQLSPKKVTAKLFILQGAVAATFFCPCLSGAHSIAYRNVALSTEVGIWLKGDGYSEMWYICHRPACPQNSKIVLEGAPISPYKTMLFDEIDDDQQFGLSGGANCVRRGG
jgi:hypothetical protein